MARGLPDDSNIVKEGALYSLDDMGELAARLGSPVNYIRFGDVYMIDEFQYGLGAWRSSILGAGGFVRLTGTTWRSKGTCVRINSGTGANPHVTFYRRVSVPDTPRVGFTFTFAYENDVDYIRCALLVVKDEVQRQFYIRITPATGALEYRNTLGAYVLFGTKLMAGIQLLFHLCKLVVDHTKDKYVSFYFNDIRYNLAAHSCRTQNVPGVADYCECRIMLTGKLAADGDMYLDDAVVTQNEV